MAPTPTHAACRAAKKSALHIVQTRISVGGDHALTGALLAMVEVTETQTTQ